VKRFFILTLIIIICLNSLALSVFFVFHSHSNFRAMRNRSIADTEQQLMNRLESFHILIQPFEERARRYNERVLQEIYAKLVEKTGGSPFRADANLLTSIAELYEDVDVYLINSRGVVERSSFEKDVGLNLFELDESFREFLESVYGKGLIYTQRISISNMKGTKMIYSYFSPEESRHILETSISFGAFVKQHYSQELYRHLFYEFFREIITPQSFIDDFDILYRTNVSTRSLLDGEKVELEEAILERLEEGETYRRQSGDSLTVYSKRSMSRSGFAFVQYPIVRLEYDLGFYREFLTQFYLIAGLSILLLIILFSLVAYQLVEYKLVRRIEELDGILQEAAFGTYEFRVEYESQIPELMNLSSSANSLIDQVQQRERELKLRLQERETLLDEIHHRVKNNLNVVISLLNLQNEQLEDVEQVKGALEKTRNRIYSIALTHEKLYHSENLTEVNMRTYVESFLSTFNTSMLDDTHISITSELDDANLSITYAVPCGIILNELLTNAVQHAFQGREEGNIKVSFTSASAQQYRLVVEDDGEGLTEGFEPGTGNTLGLLLVETLIKQIRGELHISSEDGSRFEIVFDVPEISAV